jgi:hypothetical protein
MRNKIKPTNPSPKPNVKPKELNVGPGKIVQAKAFSIKPNIIKEIAKIIPLCFFIIIYKILSDFVFLIFGCGFYSQYFLYLTGTKNLRNNSFFPFLSSNKEISRFLLTRYFSIG